MTMDGSLFDPNAPLVNLDKIVALMDHFDFAIDVKDAQTKRYIYNNLAASEVSGLSKEERVGMDVSDIARINKINETAVSKVLRADQQVLVTKNSVIFNHVFRNKEGILLVDKVVKRPILGKEGEPQAILSYARTVTPYVDLSQLYSLYKSYYRKKEAVRYFLKHLQIAKVFTEPLTDQELHTLLIMQKTVSASKYTAKLMHLSPRTIEEYKNRIRSKLRTMSFEGLLSMLRHYGRYDSNVYE